MEPEESASLASTVKQALKTYSLPEASSLFNNLVKKTTWKNMVDNAVNNHWYNQWNEDIENKTNTPVSTNPKETCPSCT